jgi:alpha-galactosidase
MNFQAALLALATSLVASPSTTVDPETVHAPWEEPMPIARATKPQPRINGPRIVGATPGKPFLFLIPATGKAPLKFAAKNLPAGLSLDATSGIISGAVRKAGDYLSVLTVSGSAGTATRELRIVAGPGKLALTPPMGWNSWQIYAAKVTSDDIRRNADAMVSKGLAAHGYQYICIDDGWEGPRNAITGELEPNEKFRDMKGLANYVHSKGLKLGIYSSPGPWTCQRLAGSLGYEGKDAQTWSAWGVDFLKYDLCSLKKIINTQSLHANQHPYMVMGDALRKQNRDIVYSLCQYGWMDVQKWGKSVGGNLWRTTDDIGDSWGTISRNGFALSDFAKNAGPGGWNDPDMLVVGQLGPGWGAEVHPTLLTPNEQISHMTLWAMTAAPLILGCDLTKLDDFTTALVTNDEVIDINQDALGKPGSRIAKNGYTEVWSRPLQNGTVAVALFNRDLTKKSIIVRWSDVGIAGKRTVRDAWRQKDLGVFNGSVMKTVPAHGSMLFVLKPASASNKVPAR